MASHSSLAPKSLKWIKAVRLLPSKVWSSQSGGACALLIELHGMQDGVATFLKKAGYTVGLVGVVIFDAQWAVLAIAAPNESTGLRPRVSPANRASSTR